MNKILIFTFVALFGLTGAYWGRYRFPSLRPGSPMDRLLGVINVFGNVAVALVGIALIMTTEFSGTPALGFIASALLLGSVFLYRVRAPDLRMAFASNSGRRGQPHDQQRKTRWPYTLTYMAGYSCVIAYISTILSHL
ncbi:hypothetical protein [Arthrobacter sp. NtRootA1]|uniref:hypothetical protein n=1 Tax=Arthrobacter sp. NtRootA1 TaxID=2830983 RepID=UPI001CC77EE2|nr:hypothetical protein [Arthrobacter sp. NtRootA1]BCW04967.1 hypothetical protein NtRootA1_11050 [Arthrobacter sp. NtRootA1]